MSMQEQNSQEPTEAGSSNDSTPETSQESNRAVGRGAIRRTTNGHANSGRRRSRRRRSSRHNSSGGGSKDDLSQRRPLDPDDDYYNRRQCDCEKEEPEPQTEYDVPGEWVTYTEEVNQSIFQMASRRAAMDLERQMRFYMNPEAAPMPRAREPASSSGTPDESPEIIDEWAAFSAETSALRALEKARQAVDTACEAKHKAAVARHQCCQRSFKLPTRIDL